MEEVERPRLDDVEVVFGKIAHDDEDRLLGCLVDGDGFLVSIKGILQHGFVELTILVQVTAGRIVFLGWRRYAGIRSLEDNVPFWGIWCMERVQFNDGNIGGRWRRWCMSLPVNPIRLATLLLDLLRRGLAWLYSRNMLWSLWAAGDKVL